MSNTKNVYQLVAIATLVGFFGDALLQVLVCNGLGGKTGWGLKSYFQQHGRAESMFTAAGMLAVFYTFYIVLKLPLKWYWLVLYGVLLDLFFRLTMVFQSLKGYYSALNYFWSAVWGAIPILLPLLIWKLLSNCFFSRIN